jgi:hypothetical protein
MASDENICIGCRYSFNKLVNQIDRQQACGLCHNGSEFRVIADDELYALQHLEYERIQRVRAVFNDLEKGKSYVA